MKKIKMKKVLKRIVSLICVLSLISSMGVMQAFSSDAASGTTGSKTIVLTGSDVYSDYYAAKSVDGGIRFGEPKLRRNLDTYTDGIRITYDMDLMYNKYHKVWFGLGRTTHYEHENHPMMKSGISFGELIAFSFNPETGDWGERLQIEFPIETISVVPMPQIIEYDNGDMLIPFYYKTKDAKTCSVVTVLYRYTENGFKVLEVGEPISGDKYTRGLTEPALAYLNDDTNDNRFLEPTGRFPEIEEDVPAEFILANEL